MRQVFVGAFLTLTFSTLLEICLQASTPESETYIAGVVEYAPAFSSDTGKDENIFTKNIANYVCLIKKAARKECDIVVFPEAGLTTMMVPRDTEGYPVISVNVTDLPEYPCLEDAKDFTDPILKGIRELSCAAKDNEIYVVVNLPEKQICRNETCFCPGFPKNLEPSEFCPTGGAFYFNTDLVFDRLGKIIARYRKLNVYEDHGFSPGNHIGNAWFETDFGVAFGMFTGFEALYDDPSSTLVKKFEFKDFVFPAAWESKLPFLTGTQIQSAWAHSHNVTLLASGYSWPAVGLSGSGIYDGDQGNIVTKVSDKNCTKLLVAKIEKRKKLDMPSKQITETPASADDNGEEDYESSEGKTPPSAFYHIIESKIREKQLLEIEMSQAITRLPGMPHVLGDDENAEGFKHEKVHGKEKTKTQETQTDPEQKPVGETLKTKVEKKANIIDETPAESEIALETDQEQDLDTTTEEDMLDSQGFENSEEFKELTELEIPSTEDIDHEIETAENEFFEISDQVNVLKFLGTKESKAVPPEPCEDCKPTCGCGKGEREFQICEPIVEECGPLLEEAPVETEKENSTEPECEEQPNGVIICNLGSDGDDECGSKGKDGEDECCKYNVKTTVSYCKSLKPKAPESCKEEEPAEVHPKIEDFSNYSTFKLGSEAMFENSTVRVCHKDFCCEFNVALEMKDNGGRYQYRLVVYDGPSSYPGKDAAVQICAVVACMDSDLDSCGRLSLAETALQSTVFHAIRISGEFRDKKSLHLANTLSANNLPLPTNYYCFMRTPLPSNRINIVLKSRRNLKFSTYSFGIYSRDFCSDHMYATAH